MPSVAPMTSVPNRHEISLSMLSEIYHPLQFPPVNVQFVHDAVLPPVNERDISVLTADEAEFMASVNATGRRVLMEMAALQSQIDGMQAKLEAMWSRAYWRQEKAARGKSKASGSGA